MKTRAGVQLNFGTPAASRPKQLQKVHDEYERLAVAAARTKAELGEARAAVRPAQERDVLELAERLRKNPDAEASRIHEQAAQARVADLAAKLVALEVAADRAGNEYAQAVGEHIGEWRAALRGVHDDAHARYLVAVAELEAAAAELSTAALNVDWADNYSVPAALAAGTSRHYSAVNYEPHRERLLVPINAHVLNGTNRVGDLRCVPADVVVSALKNATRTVEPPPSVFPSIAEAVLNA